MTYGQQVAQIFAATQSSSIFRLKSCDANGCSCLLIRKLNSRAVRRQFSLTFAVWLSLLSWKRIYINLISNGHPSRFETLEILKTLGILLSNVLNIHSLQISQNLWNTWWDVSIKKRNVTAMQPVARCVSWMLFHDKSSLLYIYLFVTRPWELLFID